MARNRRSIGLVYTLAMIEETPPSRPRVASHPAGRGAWMIRLLGRLPLQTEQKYPMLLEYAKASFERIKQRLRHL
jgi:hypothetical protein